ncbi:ABC transporter ATP-binding protein [Brevibacterium moorei]|jgi:ATP-binding cassette subfamily B protein|uniref:ABC transporter ATP-binding protein n=1 Tax=Brevibacterium moorei TaxID=2968457 RepID=UPI00211B8122|nr:ABC transporter ATP-binding protein [Brevibacterium sp. 68QC2CO]MCQ9386323.1 ABC transporter ATP-binding protein/permease [Brevibacterium sp. 68QC2CO]
MSAPANQKSATAVDELDQLPPGVARSARRLLMSLVRPRLLSVIVLALLIVLTSAGAVIGPVFVQRALDDGLPAAQAGDFAPLAWAIGAFMASALVAGVCSWASVRLMGKTAQRILFDLRGRLFKHVQRLDLGYHEKSTSGRLVARQTSDMESVQEFLSFALIDTALGLLQMAAIAVLLVFLDVPMALIAFAGFIPLFFVTVYAARTQRGAYRRTRTWIGKSIVHFTETMGGIRAVQAFRRQPAGRARLHQSDDAYRQANRDALTGVAWFAGWTRLIGNLTQVAIILAGAYLVMTGHTQIGVLTAFILYLRRFYGPLDELVNSFNLYQSASAALEKITAILDTEPAIEDPAAARALPTGAGGRELSFEQVRFAYEDGPDILPDFDLEVPAGQTVALVGTTGAGKSTLVKLATRFYDPLAGSVRLDGVDLREIDDAALRRAIVMVTQESFLFSGTIADNIRIGNPEATDEQVRAAARAVGLDRFIARLPEGYGTDVKKRGGRLSSGQRQLVSFARVFLADPGVIVLDEATAHLDIPSERAVQQALETVLRGRTAIIIAHRLSTVEIADRVLVMEHGRIVEDGTPQRLLADGGRFAHLHAAWEESLA